ncbi:MAG: class I mannose-6-phosphate isomerase [Clostridia bacterium]|nr:class I mannose-6-phosphate isomerase [Clostridia bacterium]
MKPILLAPILKNYIWGGTRLKTEYGFVSDEEKVAEAWMLSSHKDGRNVDGEMPILVKLIDARDKLSVQVHPNDEYAYRVENEPGKTEMWYIVDCEEGAMLIYGFTREISKDEFERRIRDNTLDEVMNYVPVHKGDVFFIPSGTLHAIGAGILIAEIQQSSNTTYRVSDYGRLGADGKPRQLHIEKALDVTETVPPTLPYGQIGEVAVYPFGKVRTLSECQYFSAYEIDLDGSFDVTPSNFLHILVLDGDLTVGDIKSGKGGSIYLPANCKTAIEGKAKFLISTV